jgi:hypothetical protein
MTAHDLVLRDVLQPHRSEALDRWRGFVLDSYPEESARFFRKEKDRFKNPVGQSIHRATETLFDGALLERNAEGVPEALESLVRIRAVQDFSPSEAVAFVFLLKRAVREVLAGAPEERPLEAALSELDARVDALALAAFETYTRCREELFEIRLRSSHRRVAVLLERYGREVPEGEPADNKEETDGRMKGVQE